MELFCHSYNWRRSRFLPGPRHRWDSRYATKRYKIRHVKISAYIPSAKGTAEVGHKPFIRALRKLTKGTGRRWKDHLPALVRTGTPSEQVPKWPCPAHWAGNFHLENGPMDEGRDWELKELSDEKLQLRSPPLDEGKLLVMILGSITIPVDQRGFGLALSGLGSPII